MSRHWDFKTVAGPTGGYFTFIYENTDAGTTAEFKIPEEGVYHGDPKKPLTKGAADRLARRLKTILNNNT
jgi:hypothetical protein